MFPFLGIFLSIYKTRKKDVMFVSIKSKIGSFLKIKSIKLTAYAQNKGTSKSNMHQKIMKERVYLKDLLELCSDYNCRISIVDNRTNHELISFNEYDIDKADPPKTDDDTPDLILKEDKVYTKAEIKHFKKVLDNVNLDITKTDK